MRFGQSIQSVEATNCSCTNTATSGDTCVSIRSVIALSCTLPVLAKVRLASVHSVLVAHFLLLSLPSWSITREKCSTLPTFQWFHSASAPVSMFTAKSDNCLILFSVLHLRRSGMWDPWPVEYQSCKLAKLLQH